MKNHGILAFTTKNTYFFLQKDNVFSTEPKICTDFEYTCSDKTCIKEDRLCDCNPDCSDSSDEKNCPPAGMWL